MPLHSKHLPAEGRFASQKTDTKKGDEPGTHLLTYNDCDKQLQFIDVQS